ncbi:MAG: hypothetical protein EZS28_026681 [Streblomastix strix]|uniref:Right handed beta helix domain-containing protein n=1 Tax=Streblomastix strix TaxID=222440 RepID=A0A5J4V5Y0_9EUKA|nr:MAG: hypothetical protein EZS28_026681 [Streblomastix strix]
MHLPIDAFYVGTTGEDTNSCTLSNQCLTLDTTSALRGTVNSATDYTVYVMDKTTLSSIFNISSSEQSPRTFTNNPQSSSIQSEILINSGGQFNITGNSLFEHLSFTMQVGASRTNGGIIYARIGSASKILEIISCSFNKCKATNYGGAIYLYIYSSAQAILRNLSFNQCGAQRGGALFANLTSAGKITISGSCSFKDCNSSYGGGIGSYVDGYNSQVIIEDQLTFERCSSSWGGGMLWEGKNQGKLTMTGFCQFKDCTGFYGGGYEIYVNGQRGDIQLLGNIQFEGCKSEGYGGGLYIDSRQASQIIINQVSFSNCNAKLEGGGFYSSQNNQTQMTIQGKITFENCHSDGVGGGCRINALGVNSKVNIIGEQEYNQCEAQIQAGGLSVVIRDNAIVELNNASFKNCSCNYEGGGLFVYIRTGQFTLDKSCQFYQCKSFQGYGGGIYIDVDFITQCSFIIKDVFIHECQALNSTNSSLSYSRSGFGGGLFLGIFGDYDPNSKLIDLRGMKIYNNSADKFGQSLYIVMTKVVDFCQYGILGEYVKGNYSDVYSDENDLEGIPKNLNDFYNLSQEEIEQQSQPLEPLWRILGTLKM